MVCRDDLRTFAAEAFGGSWLAGLALLCFLGDLLGCGPGGLHLHLLGSWFWRNARLYLQGRREGRLIQNAPSAAPQLLFPSPFTRKAVVLYILVPRGNPVSKPPFF